MDNYSDDSSCVDSYPRDRRALSPSKAPLSSKATAFSIAALMGREGEPEKILTPTSVTSQEDPEEGGQEQIAPLGKMAGTGSPSG